jgi:hypothetical protein
LVLLVGAVACGDDSQDDSQKPVTPPDNPERNLPTLGGPSGDAGYDAPPERDAYVREDRVRQDTGAECCPVTFAFAPRDPAEVEEAVLRGSLYPLDTAEGVPLQETDGVWTGQACLAPDQYGTYHYELGLETGGDELFVSIAHNPHAPTTTVAGELVNEWVAADDCASIDVAVHAQTSE